MRFKFIYRGNGLRLWLCLKAESFLLSLKDFSLPIISIECLLINRAIATHLVLCP